MMPMLVIEVKICRSLFPTLFRQVRLPMEPGGWMSGNSFWEAMEGYQSPPSASTEYQEKMEDKGKGWPSSSPGCFLCFSSTRNRMRKEPFWRKWVTPEKFSEGLNFGGNTRASQPLIHPRAGDMWRHLWLSYPARGVWCYWPLMGRGPEHD